MNASPIGRSHQKDERLRMQARQGAAIKKDERLRMQARQGAAIKKMSGCECKPDRAQPSKNG